MAFSIPPKISKRGNRYLRVLFVQAAWAVLIKPKSWDRHGLKPWLEAAKKRLHHNVLAIALANKLARIAWSVLAHGRAFEARRIQGREDENEMEDQSSRRMRTLVTRMAPIEACPLMRSHARWYPWWPGARDAPIKGRIH
jgi:Transposase IS116/IS110/IS902 family